METETKDVDLDEVKRMLKTGDTFGLMGYLFGVAPRLIDGIERLTADNARLTAELQAMRDDYAKIHDIIDETGDFDGNEWLGDRVKRRCVHVNELKQRGQKLLDIAVAELSATGQLGDAQKLETENGTWFRGPGE